MLLILPYWNVNNGANRVSIVETTFNLTILECKLLSESDGITFDKAFNLTILECKFQMGYKGLSGFRNLLILPYWNVNE